MNDQRERLKKAVAAMHNLLTDEYMTAMVNGREISFADQIDLEVDALIANRVTVPESDPKPLTICQLIEMDGEPVYWPKYDTWGIVMVDKYGNYEGIPFLVGKRRGLRIELNIENHKIELYRNKPREVKKT